MRLLSLTRVCSPLLPDKAAAVATLSSLPSIILDDHAEKVPDSKLSAKIRSEAVGGTFGVPVAVAMEALVAVAGTTDVCMPMAVGVRGRVAVMIGAGMDVRVAVGAAPDPLPTQLPVPESVKFCPAIGTNCQS